MIKFEIEILSNFRIIYKNIILFIEKYEEIEHCIILDTETVTDTATGISKVWELGLVVLNGVDIIDTKEWLIAPDAKFEKLDIWYPEEHISVEKIKSSPKFEDLLEELLPYLNEEFIIGGHNVDYDLRVINRELNLLNLPLIGSKKFDTIRLARKVHPEWSKFNLDHVCNEYSLNIEKRHRALDDAYATAEAFIKMREKLNNPIAKALENEEIGLF